jgi:hypothetical protein
MATFYNFATYLHSPDHFSEAEHDFSSQTAVTFFVFFIGPMRYFHHCILQLLFIMVLCTAFAQAVYYLKAFFFLFALCIIIYCAGKNIHCYKLMFCTLCHLPSDDEM